MIKTVHVVSVNLQPETFPIFKGVVIIWLLVWVYISMLFKYKVFVILVNQSFNQHINSSPSTMDDAQCNKYLGNFISTPNFTLSFVLISITYYIIKK